MSGLSPCRACPRVGPVEAISGIPSHRRPGRVVPPDHAHRPISWHRRRTGVAGGHTVLRTGRRRLSAAITACATPAAGDAVGSLAEGPGGPAGVTHCPPIKWRLAGRAATGPGSGARRTPPEAQRGRNSAGLQFGTKIRRCPAMSESESVSGGAAAGDSESDHSADGPEAGPVTCSASPHRSVLWPWHAAGEHGSDFVTGGSFSFVVHAAARK